MWVIEIGLEIDEEVSHMKYCSCVLLNLKNTYQMKYCYTPTQTKL